MKTIRLLAFAFALAAGSALATAAEITVHAAASLSDVLTEVAALHARSSPDRFAFNYGGTGALARQIREGAPGDLFISADELRADQLEKAGFFLEGTRCAIARNSLVLIELADGGPVLAALDQLSTASVRRIAIGEPATVPVGTYTKEYLQKLGMWSDLVGKFVPAENVRAVLAAVEAGNAEAGFVYRTDALISNKVRIAFEVPVADGPRISYPAAVLREAKYPENARAFIAFLVSPEAQAVFAKFGFLPPN